MASEREIEAAVKAVVGRSVFDPTIEIITTALEAAERERAQSKVHQLKERIIQMMETGTVGFHFSVAGKWWEMNIEDRAGAILEMWDAKETRVSAAEIDGDMTNDLPAEAASAHVARSHAGVD